MFVFHLRQMIVSSIVVNVWIAIGVCIYGSWYIIFKQRLFEISVSSLAIDPLFDIFFFMPKDILLLGQILRKYGWWSDILE